MGLTRPFTEQHFEGTVGKIYADYVMPASYSAGGAAILPADLGMSKILGVKVLGVNTAGIGLKYVWNHQTGKIMALFPTGGAGTAPTTLIAPAVADSGSGGDSDTFSIVPGIGKEVGATADLSGVTLQLEITVIP